MARKVRIASTMPHANSLSATDKLRLDRVPRNAVFMLLSITVGAVSLWNRSLDPATWFAVLVVGAMLRVRLPLGRATLSMSACFEFAALCCLPIWQAIVMSVVAEMAVEWCVVQKEPQRAIYNGVLTALTVGMSAWVFHLMSGSQEVAVLLRQVRAIPAFAVTATTYYVINRSAVTHVVALERGIGFCRAWARNFGNWFDVASCATLFAFGTVIAAANERIGTVAVVCVLPLLWIVCEGYRHILEPANVRRRGRGPS